VADVEDPSIDRSLQAAGRALGFRAKQPVVELPDTCARKESPKNRTMESTV